MLKFGDARVLIAMDDLPVRRGLVDAFRHSGFARPAEAADLETFQRLVDEATFDLIVQSTDLKSGFAASVIGDIRGGRGRHHPFPVVVMYLSSAETEYVKRVIDCGPDDLLLMPVVPGQALSRIAALAQRRKPFIVTGDYTGPDRRRHPRAAAEQAAMIDIPNPLAAQAAKITPDRIEAEIAASLHRLHIMKLERATVELLWLDQAVADSTPRTDGVSVSVHMARLRRLAAEIPLHLPAGGGDDLRDLAAVLVGRIDTLEAAASVQPSSLEALRAGCVSLAADIKNRLPGLAAMAI